MRIWYRCVGLLFTATLLASCAATTTTSHPVDGTKITYDSTSFNNHCRDAKVAMQLRAMGPLYAIGASVSHGLFATSFPDWIKTQMCLSNDAFEDDYFFLWLLKSNGRILKHLSTLRPKLIVALDFPYHYVKMQRADDAKDTLKHYLGILLMDCDNKAIDCSDEGAFSFVRKENFKPIVLAGTIYYDCAEDERVSPPERSFKTLEQCRRENIKLNQYMYELKKDYPNLHVLPVYEMIMALHHTKSGIYRYKVGGIEAEFKKGDLFVDGFHPWTNPGTHVLANLVIDWINRKVEFEGEARGAKIPYIPLELK